MRRIGVVRPLCVATVAAVLMAGVIVEAATPAFAAVPTVTSVAPANGSWQGGVTVTITGTGFFNGGTSCAVTAVTFTTSFSAVPATWTPTCSDTSLVATSPNALLGSAGLIADITVTTPGGTSAVVVGDHFAYANCTFNGLAAGAVIVVNPGTSSVAISCTNLQASASFLMAIVSPIAGIVTPFSVASDEALIMNNDPALPPSVTSTAGGTLTTTLAVPIKTTGGNAGVTSIDGDGVCPPTQDQVNQGLLTCAVAVANLSGTNFGNALFEYPGQPSPQTPTLALSPTGLSTTTITATGTGWWGAGPGSGTIPAANIRIGCTGVNPCVGGTPAVSSNLTVTGPTYFITCAAGNGPCTGPFTPSMLSGTFNTGGATGTIAIDQPTTAPTPCSAPANCFPGNGPGGTVEATASSSLPAATATGTGYTPYLGNSGCGGGASGCVPNNAISNSGIFPNPNQFWQPAAGVDSTGTLNYQVDLPAATTVSAVTTLWAPQFAPPTGYNIQTSPDGTTWTTQVAVTGNTLRNRTDVFVGGQVTGVLHVRLQGITGFTSTSCCGYAQLALVKFGWDGHGVVFPQAISPNTTVWNGSVFNDRISAPIITSVISVGVTGTTTYTYVVTAVNALGETLPSPEKATVTGNATLSATNFNAITWAPVPGAVSYNVYGRTAGAESFLGSVPVVNPPVLSCVAPCFNDTGQALTPALKPPTRGTAVSNPLTNPGIQSIVWQPTAAAGPGASYEVDLGAATTLSAATPTWSAFFAPPAAYEIDTSSTGATGSWTTRFITTTNTSQTATDVFPGGQVSANYMRIVINAPFPTAGSGHAGVALVQFSWRPGAPTGVPIGDVPNGVTSPATPPSSSLFPQGYYPTTLPNSATLNTTATWNPSPSQNRVPDNGFNGASGPGSTWGSLVNPLTPTLGGSIKNATSTTLAVTTSGSTTINSAAAIFVAPVAVGEPVSGIGVGVGAVVTVVNSTTQITVSVASTATSPIGATGTVILEFGGTSWWQPVGAAANTGNLTFADDLGTPRTISRVTGSWLNASFCPAGPGTCAGFNPLTYQLFTSPNGSQNSWTLCATVTNSATNFTTSDACAGTGVVYVEYVITTWNSPSTAYGPALNSLTIT